MGSQRRHTETHTYTANTKKRKTDERGRQEQTGIRLWYRVACCQRYSDRRSFGEGDKKRRKQRKKITKAKGRVRESENLRQDTEHRAY